MFEVILIIADVKSLREKPDLEAFMVTDIIIKVKNGVDDCMLWLETNLEMILDNKYDDDVFAGSQHKISLLLQQIKKY